MALNRDHTLGVIYTKDGGLHLFCTDPCRTEFHDHDCHHWFFSKLRRIALIILFDSRVLCDACGVYFMKVFIHKVYLSYLFLHPFFFLRYSKRLYLTAYCCIFCFLFLHFQSPNQDVSYNLALNGCYST